MDQDLNWREHMLRALQEGKLTAMITFDGMWYSVTMQPIEPDRPTTPAFAHRKAICALCGEIIILEQGAKNWYHREARYGNHLGQPIESRPKDEEAAPAAPNTVEPAIGTQATCNECGRRIVYVKPFWQHTGLLSPRHPATPTIWWQRCTVCGRRIEQRPEVSTEWVHTEHIPVDHDASPPTVDGVTPVYAPSDPA